MKTTNKTNNKIPKWNNVIVDPETGEISQSKPEPKPKAKAKVNDRSERREQLTEEQEEYEITADAFIRKIKEKAPLVGLAAAVLKQRGVEFAPAPKSEWVLDMDMIKRLLATKANNNGLYLHELKEINAHFITHKLKQDGGINDPSWVAERADNCFNSVIGNALAYVAKRMSEDKAIEWDEELTRYNNEAPESLYLPQQRLNGEYTRVSMLSLSNPVTKSTFGDSTGIFGSSPYPDDTENSRTNMFNHNNRKGRG